MEWLSTTKENADQSKNNCVFVSLYGNNLLYLQCYNNRTMEEKKVNILLTDEAKAFVRSLPEKARKKVTYNILRVEGGEIDKDLFKKLNDDIWELRSSFNGLCYRLLAFWDKTQNSIIIATHGIVKKTWKVPQKEIAKAEAIMKEYYSNE